MTAGLFGLVFPALPLSADALLKLPSGATDESEKIESGSLPLSGATVDSLSLEQPAKNEQAEKAVSKNRFLLQTNFLFKIDSWMLVSKSPLNPTIK